jgi:hypothetical protein
MSQHFVFDESHRLVSQRTALAYRTFKPAFQFVVGNEGAFQMWKEETVVKLQTECHSAPSLDKPF